MEQTSSGWRRAHPFVPSHLVILSLCGQMGSFWGLDRREGADGGRLRTMATEGRAHRNVTKDDRFAGASDRFSQQNLFIFPPI